MKSRFLYVGKSEEYRLVMKRLFGFTPLWSKLPYETALAKGSFEVTLNIKFLILLICFINSNIYFFNFL